MHNVPCLCPNCIKEDGQCFNKGFADPWRLINLIPEKGANLQKYQKCKHPDQELCANAEMNSKENTEKTTGMSNNDNANDSSDDELPEISFDDVITNKETHISEVPMTKRVNDGDKIPSPVTDHATDSAADQNVTSSSSCSWLNESEKINRQEFLNPISEQKDIHEKLSEDVELIEICKNVCQEFRLGGENLLKKKKHTPVLIVTDDDIIPDEAYWHSFLTAMQECEDYPTLAQKCREWYDNGLWPLQKRVDASFVQGKDVLDAVAQADMPFDGPSGLRAVFTTGDGNCLC